MPGSLTLTTGSRLAPYEILAPIGAGGMGEVFRARDTKLDREVNTMPGDRANVVEDLRRAPELGPGRLVAASPVEKVGTGYLALPVSYPGGV